MNESELRLGKVLAVSSYATFLINGIAVRSEALVFVAGGTGLLALGLILPRWAKFPTHVRLMLALMICSLVLVAYKAIHYPIALTFLATIPAAITIALYAEAFPSLFRFRLVLILIMAYMSVLLALGGSPDFIIAGSRNQISVVLVSIAAVALAQESRRTDLWLTLAIFGICVLAVGSSGILASAVLVGATLFQQKQPLYIKLLVLTAVVSTFILFNIYIEYYASTEFVRKFSFDRLTGEDVRFQIIDEYVRNYLVSDYLWIGAPDHYTFHVYSSTSRGGAWSYVNTLHNSYLSAHAKIGILSVLLFGLIVHVLLCFRNNIYLALIYFSLLLRAFSDSAFILDGYYNFAFYYFFILASHIMEDKNRARAMIRQSAGIRLDKGHPAMLWVRSRGA